MYSLFKYLAKCIVCNILFCIQIAAEVSAPLAKTDEIVLVGDNGPTGDVARLASGIPPAIKTLTGLDISQVLKRLHPGGAGGM